jgi:hypothetical protein
MALTSDPGDPLDPALVAALAGGGAYPLDPHAAEGIEHVQTHLSHVFLTRDRVYKLHKDARFEFVDFSSKSERDADALREVRLNRRLAPDVYLGVAPVYRRGEEFELGEPAETLAPDAAEHCVVMRRLPADRDALSLLEQGRLDRPLLGALALRIARFHAEAALGAPAPFSAETWQRRAVDPFLACFEELSRTPLAARAARADEQVRALAAKLAPCLEHRRVAGSGVDGHGDLHLQHVWFPTEQGEPLAIDCIAFREDLRRIDAASDVAFLVMDLIYRGERGLGEHALQEYSAHADDHDLYAVVDFFVAYRAAVRAKVAALAAADAAIEAAQRSRAARSAEDHLTLAEHSLEPRPPGSVVAIAGLVGTGKSTVARALAERLEGVVVSSDRVRKARAGLEPTERASASFGEGLYDPARTLEVYAELAARALTIARSGRVAILDASFARRQHRDELRRALGPLERPPLLLEVECAPECALRRLEARAREGADPSDAGPELYARFARTYQPPREWPVDRRFRLATDGDWADAFVEVADAIAETGR